MATDDGSDENDTKWITEDLLRRAEEKRTIKPEDAELIRKADLENKGVVAAGEELGMPKATASTKRTRILQNLRKFRDLNVASSKKDEASPRVFLLLDQKKGLTEIVEETGYPPETVEKLQEDFIRLKEKDLNHPSLPRRLAELERRVKELEEGNKYNIMTMLTVAAMPGFHPSCPDCAFEMDEKKEKDGFTYWECSTCGWTYPL